MSLAFANNMPGVDASVTTVENEYVWGPNGPAVLKGVQLSSAAVDATSTPTTILRRGLILGVITASGLAVQYDASATDGSQVAVGILDTTTDMLDPRTGSTRAKAAQMRVAGSVKVGQLYGFDENARVQLSPRFLFDDFRQEMADYDQAIAKTADYTVLAADNGKMFTNAGAGGAVTFTLPTVARGYRFKFFVEADQTVTVAAAANKLVATNNATATSIAFSTGGSKIGSCVEIVSNAAGTKYLAIIQTPNAATLA